MLKLVAGVALIAISGGVAFAQEGNQTVTVTGPGGKDQTRVVCRTNEDTGSRLSKSKECHTLAEWADVRRQQREIIERTQNARTMNGNTGQ